MPSLAYRPTRKDLLDACRLHDLGVVLGWRMLLLVGGYTVAVGGLAYLVSSLVYRPLAAGLIAGAVATLISVLLLALRGLLLPRYLVRRQLREQRAYRGEWHLTWSEQGYRVQGETASSEMAWGHYVRWRQNARVILLYQSWQSYQFVPKRVLPSGADDFIRTRLQAAGVPQARLLPCLHPFSRSSPADQE